MGGLEAAFGERDRLASVLEFNFMPLSYMDSSWWRDEWLLRDRFERLRRCAKAQPHLSGFVRKRLDLPLILDFDYQSPIGRLALSGAERLAQLVRFAGVTRLSPRIASVLRQSEVKEIKQRIGADGHEFALRSGRLVLRQTRLDKATAPELGPDLGKLDEVCWALGVEGLAAALAGAPAPLTRRLQLKLPKSLVAANWQGDAERSAQHLRLFTLLPRQIPGSK